MKKYAYKTVSIMLMSIVLLSIFSSCSYSGSKNKNSLFASEKVDKTISDNDEMFGGNLSNFKGHASSSANASADINIPGSMVAPSASIAKADVENVPQHTISSGNAVAASSYIRNQSQSFKTSNVASVNN